MARRTSPKKYASNLFKNMELEMLRNGIRPRTQQSRDWFRRKARGIRRVNRNALMKEQELILKNSTIVGSMFMFFYDPKHRETLPFYDAFPLVIVVGPAEGGFYGLNLHYLPPLLRAKFLDALMDITNNDKYDESTRFKVSYRMLKKASTLKYFKPCFKHYLTDHVRSRFAMVPPHEWEIAAFLPTQDFQKSGVRAVYSDSRKQI